VGWGAAGDKAEEEKVTEIRKKKKGKSNNLILNNEKSFPPYPSRVIKVAVEGEKFSKLNLCSPLLLVIIAFLHLLQQLLRTL
jgi:hypothetical protein